MLPAWAMKHNYPQTIFDQVSYILPLRRHCLSGNLRPRQIAAYGLWNACLAIYRKLTDSRRDEGKGDPHHVFHPTFHVDYTNSDASNAIAFRHERYSFVCQET